MKKYVLGLIFVFIASAMSAQDQKVSGGLYVSPIISWLKPDSKAVEKDGSRFGFGFGIPIDFNFSKNFSLSTGVSFANLGGNLEYVDSIIAFTSPDIDTIYGSLPKSTVIKYRAQYIEIPISLKGKTNEIGYITYFLKAGISPCFRFKAKGDVTITNGSNIDLKEQVRAFNMGYHIAGGIEYSLGGSTKLLVEAVFVNGLSNFSSVETKDKTGEVKNNKVISNSLSLRVGILF